MDKQVIKTSFRFLEPELDALAHTFYQELFQAYPTVVGLFAQTDTRKQAEKLARALRLLVGSIDDPNGLSRILKQLGQKHQGYGAEEVHYDAVKAILIKVMKKFAGEAWNDAIAKNWDELLDFTKTEMLAGYKSSYRIIGPKGIERMTMQKGSNSELWALLGGVSVTAALALCGITNIVFDGMSWGAPAIPILVLGFAGVAILSRLLALRVADLNARTESNSELVRAQTSDLKKQVVELESVRTAIATAQAYIEFDLEGKILTANEIFCQILGYESSEVVGKHHAMFVDSQYAKSQEYKEFWRSLSRGETSHGEYKRLNKSGHEIWIEANYAVITDENNSPVKIVKFARNITEQKNTAIVSKGQLEAISQTQAIAEFDMQGNVITANDNFCKTLGYSMKEIQGMNHQSFCDERYARSDKYKAFWGDLINGEARSGEYKRLQKDGSDIWLSASYNPILDSNGNAFKVIKFAVDVTEQRIAARLQTALNVCRASVMVANNNMTIIYANQSVVEMFSNREAQLKTAIPNLSAEELVGTCVDEFHSTPKVQRDFIADLKEPFKTVLPIAGLTFELVATPMFETDGTRVGTVLEWNDVTDELARDEKEDALASENARIRKALDSATSSIMLADENDSIAYINTSAIKMFEKSETQLRQTIPGFSSESLIGKHMDTFHRNPGLQQGVVRKITETHIAQFKISGLSYQIVATPMISPKGKRLGTVLEWKDRTEELAVEEEVQNVLQRVASGDLTKVVEGEYEGFFGNLKTYINATVEKLVDIVQQIKEASEAVATGSEEICQGNANLSQRTEEQASSLEETSSSMEEMTSTVQQNAENAREADKLAQGAKETAEHGGEVVGRAVTAMSEINGASKRIADIISVIDEIAFQTNLLALNASVEAARAGEQGRGFAVVASEVRNLAGRSATAAKEIKDLIEDSVAKVEQGSKLVDESGITLSQIITAVQKVTSIVGEISGASVEQAAGIEEVNRAITLMDEMTQQNAALVEQAAAASEAMGDQASELKGQMSFFKLNNKQIASNSNYGARSTEKVVEMKRPLASVSAGNSQPRRPAVSRSASSNSASEWEEF